MNAPNDPRHEDALRALLGDEAARYTPAARGWEALERRLDADRRRRRIRTGAFASLSAAAAVLVAVVAVSSLGGDGTEVATVPANRGETRSTTEATAPPPAPAPAADEVGPGIWPFTTGAEADASDESAYTDPVETARRFLTEYVGFTRLTMGEFAQGDSRSGEVTATSRTDGPVTTVLVRLLGSSDRWTVIGAVTPNIVLEVPGALEEVGSPVRIEGRSTAFEGNVVVEVRQDGGPRTTLGLEPLTGGSMGELGPLVGNVPIRTPTERGGAVLATTDSAMDGAVEEATVVRVRFAGPEDPGG